jgi:purine-binding chemotaxis protein CheW
MNRLRKLTKNQPKPATTLQLVGFVIGDEMFGVDILTVQEIIRDATITPIPDSPDFLEGVINLRGSIIPVIDLRKRLKLVHPDAAGPGCMDYYPYGRRPCHRICRGPGHQGVECSRNSIKPPPDIVVAGLKSQYIRGVCKLDQRLLILLDFSRILMVDEIKKLKSMKRSKVPVGALACPDSPVGNDSLFHAKGKRRMGKTILVVDDSSIMRKMIKQTLIGAGHTVVGEAKSGDDAVAICTKG